ncbi:MAG: Transport permease protein [Frankiales bacterium]|nr:Transport permease protein [Frankiales bacterium]
MRAADDVPEWRVNSADPASREGVVASLWRARDLIGYFALRDLRVRYKQAALGVVWVLLQPIASVALFTLVFRRVANISSQGIAYPLFALVGMTVWLYFSTAVVRGSEVLVESPDLITKVSFPRIAAPAAAMLAPLADFAVSFVLVIVLFAYYSVTPSWRLLATPIWLVLVVLAALGVALWLSALNVKYRDVRHAMGPLVQLWLFASPVAYPSSLLSGWKELAIAVNPMTGLIGLARWSVLGTPWPGWPLAVSLASLAAIMGSGLVYFRRAERAFADVI